jgi:NADH-quinone oxidoreductase subunit N
MSVLPAPFLLPVDWWALGAVLALSVGAMLLLLLEFLPAKAGSSRAAVVALVALAVSALAVTVARDARRTLFGGMFVHDGFTVFFTLLFCASGAFAVLLSWDYVKRTRINHAEYYALLLCATLGMVLMAASNDLITIFLGLELMSLALYVLVGFRRDRLESNEAALKYFLLGAFASGFFLYGIALLYGATGTTNLAKMAAFLGGSPLRADPLLLVGGLLLLVGFFFKVAAVPFHMWTPDAYEGAPTSVTAFMSVGAVAMLTMTVGNVTALLQNNLKRMLAYSSIAHAGTVLVAVAAGGPDGASAALFYLVVYSVMNLGAFGVLTILGRGAQERVLMADVRGLGFRRPLVGVALAVFMISLGGIPPTAGFIGKFTVFASALKAGLLPLVIVGVLNSVVAVYYYLRVTVALYMQEPQGEPTEVSWAAPAAVAIVLALALTLWWGVQAGGLLEQARRSVLGLL